MICTNFQKMSGRFSVFAFMFFIETLPVWGKETSGGIKIRTLCG